MAREKSWKTFFVLLCSVLFASCNFDQPVKQWFDYWTSTCQVGKIEYTSENTLLNGETNLYANDPVEINLYLVNPQKFKLLQNPAAGQKCFTFKDEDGKTIADDHEEIIVDPTWIKIRADLPDESEGKKITLSGCLWPENRSGFSEDQLKTQCPQLFYSASFVQNTPPDNVKNMNSSGEGDFYGDTKMHYLSFTLPDLSLRKNHGSRYEIKTYLRDIDGELYYKGSQTISIDDSDMGSRTYMYLYDGQEEFLPYEYTVQVLGPHGLNAELLATDPRLGVHQLTEPTITISGFNGLEDENQYKCIEVESESDSIPFTTAAADPSDTLTVKVDGTDITGGNYAVSGIGTHIIEVISSKDGSRPISVFQKIRIVQTPNPASFKFTPDYNGLKNDSNPDNVIEYIEVDEENSTVTYSISPTDEGTTVSGTIDGTNYTNTVSGPLEIGLHKLVSIIHKEYCQPVTLVKNIMVARKLQEPEYSFTPALNGKQVGDYEYLEVTSSSLTAGCTIHPSSADSNAKVSVKIGDGTASSPATQYIGELPVGDNTITVTVSKDYMTPREFTRNIRVDSKLTKPEITCTDLNGKKDSMGYEYIEVDDSNSTASYKVTNKDSRTDDTSVTTVVTAMPDNTTVSTYNSGQLATGTPGSPKQYKIVSTIKKDGYVDQTTTKLVAVVTKLKTPKIEFGKGFNGTGKDSSGYLYIEVPDSTTTVSYASSSDDNSGSNNPVIVTTKFGEWAEQNTGNLNTNVGEYDITVTASCAFQNDATYTTKVKVVQELQEPNYSFTPGLTSESNGKWIEVPSTDHNVFCKITAQNSAESLTVRDNATSIYSPTNFTISSLGDHTLSVTVSRANYISKTFSKTIKIVEELQEPVIKLSYDGSTVTTSGTPEASSYMLYDAYNIALKSNGTGALSYEVSPNSADTGATVKVEECYGSTSEINSNGTLALGPHKIKCSVSKDGYVTREFDEKWIYVQGILAPAKIQYSAKKSGSNPVWTEMANNSSTQNLQFSYISYDTMPVKVSPGNEGNEIAVSLEMGNSCIASCGKTTSDFVNDHLIGHGDNVYTITVYQSRQYCISSETATRKFTAKIKPITLTYEAGKYTDGLQVEVQGFGESSGNMNIRGQIYVKGPNTDKEIWHFQGANQTVTRNQWSTICDTDAPYKYWSDTFTSPSNTIQVTFYKFRRDVDDKTDIQFSSTDWHSFPALTLSDIKKGKGENSTAGTSWTYVCDIADHSGDKARPKIRFTATE